MGAECQLYIANLPPDMTDLDLFRIFAPFGAIASSGVKAMCNEDGSCKGSGFVDFFEEEHAKLAMTSLNGFICQDGGSIKVSVKICCCRCFCCSCNIALETSVSHYIASSAAARAVNAFSQCHAAMWSRHRATSRAVFSWKCLAQRCASLTGA